MRVCGLLGWIEAQASTLMESEDFRAGVVVFQGHT